MANQGGEGPGGLKRIAIDLSTAILFLALFLTTGDILLTVGVSMVFGLAQAVWMIARRQKIDPMQWMALALVVVLGGATFVTRNPTFAVLKPSIFEAATATMMLRPGWATRYAPATLATSFHGA